MLSKAVLEELRSYIEANLKVEFTETEANLKVEFTETEANLKVEFTETHFMQPCLSKPAALDEEGDLDVYIKRLKKPGFTQTLFKLMDACGKRDSEIYTRAGLDRRHFSKIRSNPDYQPSKSTAIALALALELDRKEAEKLLASAGYTLSESETFDLVIAWCIEKGRYNLVEVNQALDYFSQKTIGTIA